jgi:hypothetical protein
MKTIQEINESIAFGQWTNEQLTSMIDAVKYAKARLGARTKAGLSIGDNVNFTSSKSGMNVTGVVIKIAIKFVTVKTAQGLWRVPANMLTLVEEEFA